MEKLASFVFATWNNAYGHGYGFIQEVPAAICDVVELGRAMSRIRDSHM